MAEAYALLERVRLIFRIVFGLFMLASLGVLVSTVVIARVGASAEAAVAQAQQLGQYTLEERIGAGGMGEVFRAEDTKLGRDVALKVLPASFASDPERLSRFDREARVLASLSHPSIAGIHGVEEVEGQRFLVMELAAGETPAARLARGPLAFEEAARTALRIAEALEAAHEKGVVHRDLKPGNVMVDGEGRVKVLDFGLAKALGTHPLSGPEGIEASHSPTLAMTQAGVLLGTAGYMSPEQARGKPVDRRADIWAFGCVLYEMLAGQRAFRARVPAFFNLNPRIWPVVWRFLLSGQ